MLENFKIGTQWNGMLESYFGIFKHLRFEEKRIGGGNSVFASQTILKIDIFDNQRDVVVCSNHYQSDLFLDDKLNIENINNINYYNLDYLQHNLYQP